MGRYDQYSDEELIVRLREGETEISDYLMEKYKEFVRKKARAMFLIGGETDDLIQEGMIGLFKAIQNYQKLLFVRLRVCVLTGSFTVQFKIPTDKSISR